ncbi:hypothetical protein [Pseudomonas luteola]|uniref:Uncharacterized protein n=1 Tax=Pseudomonas luteola TaxID=47886 RepID=A0ABS0FTS7_PSELU|nr:hypothetical protein [Pseudomonas zeshuii]MBF8643767.1 hypothetical protein [Pseudomonas zeshuii]
MGALESVDNFEDRTIVYAKIFGNKFSIGINPIVIDGEMRGLCKIWQYDETDSKRIVEFFYLGLEGDIMEQSGKVILNKDIEEFEYVLLCNILCAVLSD